MSNKNIRPMTEGNQLDKLIGKDLLTEIMNLYNMRPLSDEEKVKYFDLLAKSVESSRATGDSMMRSILTAARCGYDNEKPMIDHLLLNISNFFGDEIIFESSFPDAMSLITKIRRTLDEAIQKAKKNEDKEHFGR